ncbi:hypothetical protein [Streptomyces sp. NPDC056690]|uniref:hypothetical protein n=1 Tax=unclassified Streptomyces TaxID=2593676 RepID=UPI00362788D3
MTVASKGTPKLRARSLLLIVMILIGASGFGYLANIKGRLHESLPVKHWQTDAFIFIGISLVAGLMVWIGQYVDPKRSSRESSNSFHAQYLFLGTAALLWWDAIRSAIVGDDLIAGIFLIVACSVRFLPRVGNLHEKIRLKQRIAWEFTIHFLYLLFLTGGLVLIVWGIPGMAKGPQVALTATIALAGIAAMHKSVGRTRKVCTEIVTRIDSVMQSIQGLRVLRALDSEEKELDQAALGAREHITKLDIALRTPIVASYRLIGFPLLGGIARARVHSHLTRATIRTQDPKGERSCERHWDTGCKCLRELRSSCIRWVDVAS